MFLNEKYNMYEEKGEKKGFAMAIMRLLESGQSEQDVANLLHISIEEVQEARVLPSN